MKYIFDFDDVIFNDTAQFKGHMYMTLEKVGIPSEVAKAHYQEVRTKGFSLNDFVPALLVRQKIDNINAKELCDKIMMESSGFVNKELLEVIKKLGKENCFILTFGDAEHQLDKIKVTGVEPLFFEIVTVLESKKKSVEKICAEYPNEEVVFIDDKIKHFEDLDYKKYPNLKTILYTGQNLDSLYVI